MTTPVIYARAAWISSSIGDQADGWKVVVVQCPCARVSRKVPPDALLADVLDLAREAHRDQRGPECPHRCQR